MARRTLTLAALCAALQLFTGTAYSIETTIGDIIDARSNGKLQGRLEVELKITGEEVPDIEGLRASVISAIDETGRDVTDVLRVEKQLHFVNVSGAEKSVRLFLKSPSRKATVLKELIGRLDLFMPRSDPESVLLIEDVSSKTGKPLESAMLKNAGVELSVLTKQQYEQMGKAQAGSAPGAGTLVGISNLDDKSLIFRIDDAEARIVELEIQTESGEKLRPRSSTGVGNLRVFFFPDQLPAKARLKIKVATLKSVVRVPFNFENVLLP